MFFAKKNSLAVCRVSAASAVLFFPGSASWVAAVTVNSYVTEGEPVCALRRTTVNRLLTRDMHRYLRLNNNHAVVIIIIRQKPTAFTNHVLFVQIITTDGR